VARRLRKAIEQASFTIDKKKVSVTASFGLCGMDRVPSRESKVADQVLRIADAALYRSKRDGRNRVTATTYGASGD